MLNKYFDKWDFQKSLDYAETNPLEAKARFEEYIQKYPYDYSAYTYYIYVLIILGKFNEAEKLLDSIEDNVNKDAYFTKEHERVKLFKQNAFFSRLKILTYQERFKELEKFYLLHLKKAEHYNLASVIFYCRKKLNKLDPNRRDINSYLFRQIVEYKQSDFLEHIQRHLADYNVELENKNKNIFVPSFPINKIIEEITKYIPSDNSLHPGFFEDVYVFKYNSCGRENNKMVDYFKVVCFHNTKNFITMFPSDRCQNLPYVDLNYLIKDEENIKTKKLSQIEKFNRKYRNN